MSDPKQMVLKYFDGGDSEIGTSRASRMLRKSPDAILRLIERGLLAAYQPYPGAHYLISLRSVQQLLEQIEMRKRQVKPPNWQTST